MFRNPGMVCAMACHGTQGARSTVPIPSRNRFTQRLDLLTVAEIEDHMKILMVLTSHDKLGNTGRKTGFWLEEFAAPYYVFKEAGAEIVLASLKGGGPPLDPSQALQRKSFSSVLPSLASPQPCAGELNFANR